MKIVIAAGGTGGHIYPGIALAEELKSRDPGNRIVFIGSREGLEKELVGREGFEIKLIHARALLRKLSYKAVSAPFVSALGFFESLFLLASIRPDRLVVTGGYASFPVIAAAIVMRIPFFLLEQNALPGFSNRFWHRFARKVVLTFEGSQKYLPGTVLGNPVRKKILEQKPIVHDRPAVTVIGGSQGARSINRAIAEQIDKLSGIDVYHIIGKRDFNALKDKVSAERHPFYHPIEYMYNMEELLGRSDLVVSRAGATAISEILALGLPSILIPFPYSAEGHQDYNAKALTDAGAAKILTDDRISGLSEMIVSLFNDRKEMDSMAAAAGRIARRDAAKDIAEMLYAEH
ncbi:MAG TPA: undecaprenyldiphospho-muramoylpentapeptide beta-N-acetylglucosaminyltransferase [Candidatus Omnitrophota bacterium]|nr:undecaprenyldiphospho-muramoylpentapeptide beta-N-acetylglucosaminyltransferase [Candidatus Omnitrophota bacterium]